jgi:hypothetical protein
MAAAGLVLVASMAQAHEPSEPPKVSTLGPVRGKTVQVTQAQIDLMMSAQPELRKMDEAATLQTRAEVREVLSAPCWSGAASWLRWTWTHVFNWS